MFKALLYVRSVRKIREPGAVFVQLVLPVLYVIIGLLLTDITDYDNDQDQPLVFSPGLYAGEYDDGDGSKVAESVYTYVNRTGEVFFFTLV